MSKNKVKRPRVRFLKKARRQKRKEKRVVKNMSDAARLFRVVHLHIQEQMPVMLLENRATLAMLITGILRGRSGQLKKISRAVQYAHQKESLNGRFRRFVRNRNIEVEVAYVPFVTCILKAISREPIVLMIDSTKMGGRCICLMVSVYYKSRALPLAWTTFKGRKGHSSQQTQLALFRRAEALLPHDVPIILLGDGEFDGSEVVDWFNRQKSGHYVCRTDKSNKIFQDDQWTSLQDLSFRKGEEGFLTDVQFTEKNNIDPVNILVVWNETQQCHWFFVTNFQTATEARSYYILRFTIETLFSDLKGRGFNLSDTRLWLPERLNRLIFAAAVAYFFVVALGVENIVSGSFRQLVRTDAFYHSLFQLGLIYLDHIFNEFLEFPSLMVLPPPDTFEHTVIS